MSNYPYIIIIGCGSSGTKYTSKLLQRAGLDVQHERIGKDGISSWYLTPGMGSVARPPFGGPNFARLGNRLRRENREYRVIHQVRDPLKTISTFQRAGSKSWNYIYKHIPFINWDTPLIVRSMNYWLYWSVMAEGISTARFKVENMSIVLQKFCVAIGRPALFHMANWLLSTPKNVNTRKGHYKPLTWDMLFEADKDLAEQIVKKGRSYGYSI